MKARRFEQTAERLARSLGPAAGLAVAVAAVAVAPHVLFSIKVGDLAFFKNAYDEDTYFLFMLRGIFDPYRAVSHVVLKGLYEIAGRSADLTLMVADATLPALAAGAAYVLAAQVFTAWQARTLLALGLIFGQDLMSLSNVAVWPGGLLHISNLIRLLGEAGRVLVPSAETSFLSIVRTPEPQVSCATVFLLLAVLIRNAAAQRGIPRRQLAAIVILTLALPFSYFVMSAPVLLLEVWVALVFLYYRRRRCAMTLLGAVAPAAGIFGIVVLTSRANAAAFASHLPIVTPAIIGCVAGLLCLASWGLVARSLPPACLLALGFFLVPVAVSNQQILTGIMIGARDWERYINYPFMIMGAALTLSALFQEQRLYAQRYLQYLAVALIGAAALFIVRAQMRSYGYWNTANETSVAMARALEQAPTTTRDLRILLDRAELAPLVAARTSDRFRFVLDYTEVFLKLVPSLDASGRWPGSVHEQELFEYWWRRGVTPAEAEQVLLSEARQRVGYFSGFLFSLLDHSYPASDNRAVRQQTIMRQIPEIIGRYAAYSTRAPETTAPVLFLTSAPPASIRAPPQFANGLVAAARAGETEIFAYRQARVH